MVKPKPKKNYPKYVSYVTTQEAYDEVKAIARKHDTTDGEARRAIEHLGLIAYHRAGERLD